jgi:hypothetical protein
LNGRKRTVMISAEEYYRLKRRDRQALVLADFTDADIAALGATRAPASSKDFNHELTQWVCGFPRTCARPRYRG